MYRWTPWKPIIVLVVVAGTAQSDTLNGLRSSVARAGDVNGDGIVDLIVASRDTATFDRPERVWILSGKDGTRLLELRGREPGDRFGSEVGAIGDWNGDGVADLFVAAEPANFRRSTPGSGYRRLVSGRNGEVLKELPGSGAVGGTRDLDVDGKLDLLLVTDDGSTVVVVSGRDGKELVLSQRATPLANERRRTVDAVSWIDDIDGDERSDFILSMAIQVKLNKSIFHAHELSAVSGRTGSVLWSRAVEADSRQGWATVVDFVDSTPDGVPTVLCSLEDLHVRVLDGKTGVVLREHKAPTANYYAYASTLDRVGDMDCDGMEDWIVGANESWGEFFDPWSCDVFSGKTGKRIRTFDLDEEFGFDACGLGDVNGDGVPDIALGIERQRHLKPKDGWEPSVQVRSGKDASMLWVRRHADLRN